MATEGDAPSRGQKCRAAEQADAAAAEAAAKAGKAVLFAGSQKPKNKRKSDDGSRAPRR